MEETKVLNGVYVDGYNPNFLQRIFSSLRARFAKDSDFEFSANSSDETSNYTIVTSTPSNNSNSFWSSFFGNGGTGNTLIYLGGNIAKEALNNRGEQIQGQYLLESQQLTNEATIVESQRKLTLEQLNTVRLQALQSQQQNTNKLYVKYGLAALLIISLVIIFVVFISQKK